MATPVVMPRQGQSVESCILGEWLVRPGEEVVAGQVLAGYETDKAAFELEAPVAGVLIEVFFEPGDDVPVLANVAAIGVRGEDVSGLRPGRGGARSGEGPTAEREPAAGAVSAVVEPAPAAPAKAGTSPRARRLAEARGLDPAGLAGTGPGGRTIERDVRAVLGAAPRLSPAALAAVRTGRAAPSVGSGPGGMVLTGDLPAPAAAAPAAAPTESQLTGIRKLIAGRMLESLQSTAQLTLTRTADARALQGVRAKVKANGQALGLPNITLNDMVVLAVGRTLMRHPGLNAHFLGDRVRQFPFANIGIAVDTPRGLMVPVLAHVESLTLGEVSVGLRQLAAACQAGNVNPDLLGGGTFTVTNLGGLGIDAFTPVLNVPQVAILGVGGLILKPILADGGIEHIPAITLSLTINHQVVDGAPAARFLQDLAGTLENFELLLVE